MNEVIVVEAMGLVNKELTKEVTKIANAIATIGKNKWKVADAIRNISEKELYKDDFETDTALAEKLGMSKAQFSKLKNASLYHAYSYDVVEDGTTHEVVPLNDFTVTQVMEMLVIPLADIAEFLDGFEVTPTMTIKDIRECVSCWKDDNKEQDSDTESEPVANEQESETEADDPETSETESDNDECMSKGVFINKVSSMDSDTFAKMIKYLEEGGFIG